MKSVGLEALSITLTALCPLSDLILPLLDHSSWAYDQDWSDNLLRFILTFFDVLITNTWLCELLLVCLEDGDEE